MPLSALHRAAFIVVSIAAIACQTTRSGSTPTGSQDTGPDSIIATVNDATKLPVDSWLEMDAQLQTTDVTTDGGAYTDVCPSCDLAETDSVGESPGETLAVQGDSSLQPCLCWKHGGDCDLWGVGPIAPWKASKACPADELCDGDITKLNASSMEVSGTCRKVCAFEGAEVQEARGCAPTETCKLIEIAGQNDMGPIATVALCFPKGVAQGGVQDAGSGEK